MVSAGRNRPVVLSLGLEVRLPDVLVAGGTHLLPHGHASALRSPTAYGLGHSSLRLIAHTPEEHERVAVAQAHAVNLGPIILAAIGRCLGTAIPFVHESGFDGHVEYLLLVAIGHARSLFQFALALIGFSLSHRFHWQSLQQQVLAEGFLAVHHDAQGLAVPEQAPVLDADARQFQHEVQQAVAALQLEGIGVEDHRVAAHVEASLLPTHQHLPHQFLAGLQADVLDVDGVARVGANKSERALLVTEEVGTNSDARLSAAREVVAPEAVGMQHPLEGGEVGNHLGHIHLCALQRFARLSVKDTPVEDVGPCRLHINNKE